MKSIHVMTLSVCLWAIPAVADTTSIDLDSAAGSYSEWKLSDFTASSVRFTASYVAIKRHEKWAPSYKITMGDGKEKQIAFSGTYQASDVPEVTAVATKGAKNHDLGESILSFKLRDEYVVELSWATSGKLKVIVNGVTRNYDVTFRPTELQVLCSTGELEVKNISFGK